MHQSFQSGSVRWAVSHLFVKQIKLYLKFWLKRSSHRHSNRAFAICTTSLPRGIPISGTFKGKQNENGNFEYQVKIAVEQIKGKWPLVWVISRECPNQGCAAWQGMAFGLFVLNRVYNFFCLSWTDCILVICPIQGPKMNGVLLNRVGILGVFLS